MTVHAPGHAAQAIAAATPDGASAPPRSRRSSDPRAGPWPIALAISLPLAIAYLVWAPPAGDLAAATYRSALFAREGFATWDTGWYAAHGYWLPSYSLLSPALGALLGVRLLLALSALSAALMFAGIAHRAFGLDAARPASACFALGICVGMLSGRVPYYLGFALALGSVLTAFDRRRLPALGLAGLASIASPVAGAFLALGALAALAGTLTTQRQKRCDGSGPARSDAQRPRDWAALALAALLPAFALSIAYPNGGYEPFASGAFWPALGAVTLVALLLPQGSLSPHARQAMRIGSGLYALALVGAFAIHTPMGGNAARLGSLLGAPLLTGVLWSEHRRALALLAVPLLYWQLATPIRDYSSIAGDPSTHASYYAPLLAELRRLPAGHPRGGGRAIVEVPLTKAHWESAYLAGHDGIRLARGWERQLDTRYAALFYRSTLTAGQYRAWLAANGVEYVALPDAPLDGAGRREGTLVARGLPYLRELWHSEHWRLYRVIV